MARRERGSRAYGRADAMDLGAVTSDSGSSPGRVGRTIGRGALGGAVDGAGVLLIHPVSGARDRVQRECVVGGREIWAAVIAFEALDFLPIRRKQAVL